MSQPDPYQSPPWLESFPVGLLDRVRSLPHLELLADLSDQARSQGLQTGRGRPLKFVSQGQLPQSVAYETFIAETGGVPTRDNLHDRFNALVWLMAPRTKAILNLRQAQAIDQETAVGERGSVRDAATIWDENLVVVCAPESEVALLESLLAARDWTAIFLQNRHKWHSDWRVMPFGHALLEKLEKPFKAITAHTLVLSVAAAWSHIDRHLAGIANGRLSTKLFSPLPVMGIPGWDPDNARADFYADAKVFRPPRFA